MPPTSLAVHAPQILRPLALDRLDPEGLEEITAAPIGTYDPRTIAWAYRRLGLAIIPVCHPQHAGMSRGHTEGYTGQDGRFRDACRSPGKAPLYGGYQRLSRGGMADGEIDQRFAGHRGNFGAVVQEGYVVMDIDPRNGGEGSLHGLLDQHGPLPETREAATGSGGMHYLFKVPESFGRFKASGTLGRVDAPGIDWKGPGQQHIVAPSVHAAGRPYVWTLGLGAAAPCAMAPEWFLALIRRAEQADPLRERLGGPQAHGQGEAGQRKWTDEQVQELFREIYGPGERHEAAVRLAGVLRGHNVALAEALPFMLEWYPSHFNGDFDEGEMDGTMRYCYDQYGHPSADRESRGHAYLLHIKREIGHPLSDEETAALLAHEPSPHAKGGDQRGRCHALRQQAQTQGGRLLDGQQESTGGEVLYRSLLDLLTVRFEARSEGRSCPLLFSRKDTVPDHGELYDHVVSLYGRESKLAQALLYCGSPLVGVCTKFEQEHGRQKKTHQSCHEAWHTLPDRVHWTEAQYRISRMRLDRCSHGGSYRFVWLKVAGDDLARFSDAKDCLVELITHTTAAVGAAAGRRQFRGRIYSRALGFALERPIPWVQLRLVFFEEAKGDMAPALQIILQKLAPHSPEVIGEGWADTAEMLLVQLLEDRCTPLLRLRGEDSAELLDAFLRATRGRQLSHLMGPLLQAFDETSKDGKAPRPACEQCGAQLRFIPDVGEPGPEQDASIAALPPDMTLAPARAGPSGPQAPLF